MAMVDGHVLCMGVFDFLFVDGHMNDYFLMSTMRKDILDYMKNIRVKMFDKHSSSYDLLLWQQITIDFVNSPVKLKQIKIKCRHNRESFKFCITVPM